MPKVPSLRRCFEHFDPPRSPGGDGRHGGFLGVEPKIGGDFTPKMDGENNGKTY